MQTDSKLKSHPTARSNKSPASKARRKLPSPPRGHSKKQAAAPACDKFTLNAAHGFVALFCRRVGLADLIALKRHRHTRAGAPQRVLSVAELLVGLVFHCTAKAAGSLQAHLLLLGMKISASNLSQRRMATPWKVFVELMELMLRPLELTEQQQPDAYHRGLLLVAMDGTEFSLSNTEDILSHVPKARSRSGRSGFAKLRSSVLIELRNRNPLAAGVGRDGESEWALSLGLLESLPPKAMLLADRLYGCAAFVLKAMEVLKARGGHLLVRARENIKVLEVVKRLKDGSRLVKVAVRDPERPSRVTGELLIREVVARVQRAGSRSQKIRLWTDILDPNQSDASELVKLYMRRWEHELYYRELKEGMRSGDLLQSQTLETACQEVAAMIIGSSLIAEERAKIQAGEPMDKRVSLMKTWTYLEPVWMVLLLGADLLSPSQKRELVERVRKFIAEVCMYKKRMRSCPRAVRQPVRGWPRKRNQKSCEGELSVAINRC